MAQGKEWNRKKVIRSLEPFFKLGCNVRKACAYAGIAYTTVNTWLNADEELRIKVTAWQNEISAAARKALKKAIEEGNTQTAMDWIKRKEKDEFSERTEQTGANGESLVISIAEAVNKKYADHSPSSTESGS